MLVGEAGDRVGGRAGGWEEEGQGEGEGRGGGCWSRGLELGHVGGMLPFEPVVRLGPLSLSPPPSPLPLFPSLPDLFLCAVRFIWTFLSVSVVLRSFSLFVRFCAYPHTHAHSTPSLHSTPLYSTYSLTLAICSYVCVLLHMHVYGHINIHMHIQAHTYTLPHTRIHT